MKKVLIITYYWPPSGGAGVQRWLKFAKYLPEYGWTPLILTVDPQYAAYPVSDQSLVTEITGSTVVFKTKATNWFRFLKKTRSGIPSAGFAKDSDNSFKSSLLRFIRGNFFIPDPRRGWNREAYKKACEVIKYEDIKHFITTSPPHSTQLIGLKLKKKFPALKWVADLRDPWTDIYYYKQFYHLPLSSRLDRCYERKVLNVADRLITVGPSLAGMFADKYEAISQKMTVITNGYDPANFETRQTKMPERFTITYTGTISELYPLDGFLDSLVSLQNKKTDFLLRFVGLSPDSIKNKVRSKLKEGSFEFHEYTSHSQAIDFMQNSSMLLLIIPDHSSAKSILTGKLFEYIASSRRILCLGPVDGDAASILKSNGYGETFSESDTAGIEGYISESIDNPHFASVDYEMYSHRYLAGKLITVLK